MIWPVDLVSLHGHELTVNYVEHTFGLPTDEIKNHTAGDTVLLFPYKNYGIAKTAADELKEVKKNQLEGAADPRTCLCVFRKRFRN